MAELLDDAAVESALADLPGWQREDREGTPSIVRYATLSSFPAAIDAVREVAELAEQDDHHPDMDIRYRSVKFSLATHSEGGLTAKDTALAAKISAVVDRS